MASSFNPGLFVFKLMLMLTRPMTLLTVTLPPAMWYFSFQHPLLRSLRSSAWCLIPPLRWSIEVLLPLLLRFFGFEWYSRIWGFSCPILLSFGVTISPPLPWLPTLYFMLEPNTSRLTTILFERKLSVVMLSSNLFPQLSNSSIFSPNVFHLAASNVFVTIYCFLSSRFSLRGDVSI